MGDLNKTTDDVELNFRVVVFKKLKKDWQHLLDGVFFTNNLGHFAEGSSSSSLELCSGVSIGVLKGWEHKVGDLLS